MSLNPINGNVIVKPIARTSVIASHSKNYDSKGIVVACDAGRTGFALKAGVTVYFNPWDAFKHEEDTDDEFWVVPLGCIQVTKI